MTSKYILIYVALHEALVGQGELIDVMYRACFIDE